MNSKFFRTILIGLFFTFVLVNLVFAAWHVFHGDILFSADIARDFFLYREIGQKKIMLLGPRSSVSGLFHGPLWAYLNYPAYWLGQGNPIIVGWYWIFLIILFLIGSFKIADSLFNRLTAYFYVSFLSVYLVFHARGLFNPHGVFFLLPGWFFLLVRYLQTKRIHYLVAHVIAGGLLIQFQLAIGTPYVILSSLLIIHEAIRKKKIRHLAALFLILIPLANFVIFDLRHELIIGRAVQRFLLSHLANKSLSYQSIIEERFRVMLTGVEFLRENPSNLRFLITIILGIFIWLQIKDKVHKLEYLVFLYFFFGYFALSLVNKGLILYFYHYPQFSLAFLIFASLATSNYKKIFIPIFLLILLLNFETAVRNIKAADGFIGQNVDSWQFLFQLAKIVYQQPEETFGYFVYSPDAFGYQPKYAMFYAGSLFAREEFSFKKQPVTYIVAAPHPFMKVQWWKENQLKIAGEPESTIEYQNGYKIEKYLLDEKQINTPVDPNINPGIHFR